MHINGKRPNSLRKTRPININTHRHTHTHLQQYKTKQNTDQQSTMCATKSPYAKAFYFVHLFCIHFNSLCFRLMFNFPQLRLLPAWNEMIATGQNWMFANIIWNRPWVRFKKLMCALHRIFLAFLWHAWTHILHSIPVLYRLYISLVLIIWFINWHFIISLLQVVALQNWTLDFTLHQLESMEMLQIQIFVWKKMPNGFVCVPFHACVDRIPLRKWRGRNSELCLLEWFNVQLTVKRFGFSF